MKDNTKLEPRVRAYVEYQLEHYKEHKRKLSEYRDAIMPSSTPNYSGAGGGGSGESRPTEKLGIKLATDEYINEQLRILAAIEKILASLSKEDKRMIDLIYWRRSHTVTGAAMVLHMSNVTAYRHVNAILRAIAAELGFVNMSFRE